MQNEYTVSQYLVDRLLEIGLDDLFAIPGDYCAEWVNNYVEPSKINRIGPTNELNAGYAADGYARLHGVGAICVTYSVGALSAVNAIAGSFVEKVPVIVINGAPSVAKTLQYQQTGFSWHHFVNGHRTDLRIYENITVAAVRIDDPAFAPNQIDYVLQQCITQKGPVYLEITEDMYELPCAKPAGTLRPARLMVDTVGFQAPFLSLVSAGEAWQILEDFPKNPHYHTFRDGFSTLTDALRQQVEEMGGRIMLNTNLRSITKSGKNRYTLETSPAGPLGKAYRNDVKTSTIEAGQIILAIASNAMQKVFINSPVLNSGKSAAQLWEDIHSIVNMRLLKINLYFERPWWRNGDTGQPSIDYGPSFTDLPVNAVYPFYPVDGPDNDAPAALTIYCDYDNTKFWQGLQNVGPLFDSPLQQEHSKKPQVLYAASQAVVDEAIKQFRQLFKTHHIPRPVMTSYRNWDGEDYFGYAYHQWGMNTDDRKVIERMTTLVPGEKIYSCNEAWSDMQGWVNGSLRSTDLVLKEFGLEKIVDIFDGCPNMDAKA